MQWHIEGSTMHTRGERDEEQKENYTGEKSTISCSLHNGFITPCSVCSKILAKALRKHNVGIENMHMTSD